MDTKNKLINSISEYYFTIFISLSCVQFMMFLTCLMLKKSTLFIHILPITILWMVYILFKDIIKNTKEKDSSFILIKIDTLVFLIALINDGILSITNKMPSATKELTVILILVDVMLILLSLSILVNDTFNQKIRLIHDTDTKKLLSKNKSDEEIKPGDAVLGYDLNTKKPVILPFKDRFLHMLIIG